MPRFTSDSLHFSEQSRIDLDRRASRDHAREPLTHRQPTPLTSFGTARALYEERTRKPEVVAISPSWRPADSMGGES